MPRPRGGGGRPPRGAGPAESPRTDASTVEYNSAGEPESHRPAAPAGASVPRPRLRNPPTPWMLVTAPAIPASPGPWELPPSWPAPEPDPAGGTCGCGGHCQNPLHMRGRHTGRRRQCLEIRCAGRTQCLGCSCEVAGCLGSLNDSAFCYRHMAVEQEIGLLVVRASAPMRSLGVPIDLRIFVYLWQPIRSEIKDPVVADLAEMLVALMKV